MTAAAAQSIDVEPRVRLNVIVEGPPDAAALVLSNSLGSNLSMWDEVVGRLGGRVRTIRYDTRGHGRSDVPPGPYSVARLGQDVVAIMDRLGIERAAFCGLSLGGATGMWLGANAASRLSSLVLANTAAAFEPASMWQERAALARSSGLDSLIGPTMERWFTAAYRDRNPDAVARATAMVTSTPREGYAACCEALAAADLRPGLGRIEVPTLVVVGEHDPSTPPARGEEIQAAIPGAKLVSLPGAHLTALEMPESFAAALRSHLGAR